MKWIAKLIAPLFFLSAHASAARETSSSQPVLPFGQLQPKAKLSAPYNAKNGGSPLISTQAIMGVRGGASVNPKLVAATTGASVLSLYSIGCILSPDKVTEGYGIESTHRDNHIVRNSGYLTVIATMVLWFLSYETMSMNPAVAISVLPYCFRRFQNLLTRAPTEFGFSWTLEYIHLAVSCVAVYANWTNAPFANDSTLGFGLLLLLNGFVLFCAPHTMSTSTSLSKMHSRNFGNNLMIDGVFFAALALTQNIFQAFGYCWIFAGLGIGTMTFVTKDIPTIAVNPCVIWMLLMLVFGAVSAWP
ncbi:expressed unknown protein [Seminavis robusta]|uniref:Uncharacterized protein n=1 Tax=Seminavis robusta TaxID=568900 RepID=A0A9N8HHP4_9STRA|nr:expressed unknown protein [Seminavis robusta]|eukprot:Sro650_g181470.1 n/a (303) ;mRNA; r:49353-50261